MINNKLKTFVKNHMIRNKSNEAFLVGVIFYKLYVPPITRGESFVCENIHPTDQNNLICLQSDSKLCNKFMFFIKASLSSMVPVELL